MSLNALETRGKWYRRLAQALRDNTKVKVNDMVEAKEELSVYRPLVSLIAAQFGPLCEVVLHDFSQTYDSSYEKTVIAIENGHVTGRKVGDCGSNRGLEVLRGTRKNGNKYGYYVRTKEGKLLRSSTLYIRDAEDRVIGAFCINLDVTDLVNAEKFLRLFCMTGESDLNDEIEEVDEVFVNNVSELLEALIEKALVAVGKPVESMTRSDKVDFIGYLDQRGAFLVTKAGNKICEFLGISKYSLYSYLDDARSEKN